MIIGHELNFINTLNILKPITVCLNLYQSLYGIKDKIFFFLNKEIDLPLLLEQ